MMDPRPETVALIRSLHLKIENILKEELKWLDENHPIPESNYLLQQIRETRVYILRHSRDTREGMVEASAQLRESVGK